MAYEVVLTRRAIRALDALPPREEERVRAAIEVLRDQPRPPGTKKLRARTQWRIRVGEYRVIYSIFDRDRTLIIEDVLRRTTHSYD